jgi:hypothetical protein
MAMTVMTKIPCRTLRARICSAENHPNARLWTPTQKRGRSSNGTVLVALPAGSVRSTNRTQLASVRSGELSTQTKLSLRSQTRV